MKTCLTFSLVLAFAAPLFAQGSSLRAQLKAEIREKLRDYAKDKALSKTIDELFGSETINAMVEWASHCKTPHQLLFYAIFKVETAGIDDEKVIQAQNRRADACLDFLKISLPNWRSMRVHASEELKAISETAGQLKARESKQEFAKTKLKDFDEFNKAEERWLASKRENLATSQRDLDRIHQQQEALTKEIADFKQSDTAKRYNEWQNHWPTHFRQAMQSYPGDAAHTKTYLDHFLTTGDLLPNPPRYITMPKIWPRLVEDTNRANRAYKEAKKVLDDREARLRTNEGDVQETIKKLHSAIEIRSKALREKRISIEPVAKQAADETAALKKDRELEARRKQSQEDVAIVRAGDRLIAECIAVREKAKGETNWRAGFTRVLEETSNILPGRPGMLFDLPSQNPFRGPALSPGNPFVGPSPLTGPAPKNPFATPEKH